MASAPIHRHEKEQFIKLFKQDRIDRFKDRLAVVKVFLHNEHHATTGELTDLVQKKGYGLDADFVEETMELMCRYGFAHRNRFADGQIRYEHRHLGQHHDHMICTKCQRIFEFENQALEQLQQQIAAAQGFHVLQHKMELYGICRQCRQNRDLLMPLDIARSGEKLTIKAFRGGSEAKLRLLSMGIRIGDRVEVITNLNQGQVVIALDYKRLVLGRGLAHKVLVSPISHESAILADVEETP
jgi:Fur family ferric uptake transcriptional regulator